MLPISDLTALPLQEEKALDLTVRSRDHRRPSSKVRQGDPKTIPNWDGKNGYIILTCWLMVNG
jgi:hypothetical protein